MSAASDTLQQDLTALLENAVKKAVAPGFQCVVFNRNEVLFNQAAGHTALPGSESRKPMTPSTIFWIASCTKLVTSLVALHVIERKLTKNGFTMADLDNHEKLVEVLPEFEQKEGNLLSQILEGFEDAVDKDGRRIMKLRPAKNKVTLRMLLTHTAGIDNGWHRSLAKELYTPTDGSVPHKGEPHYFSGLLDSLVLPLVYEPGTEYLYSLATAWVGVFAERASGKLLPRLIRDIILDPLGISQTDAGMWLPPECRPRRSHTFIKNYSLKATELTQRFTDVPFNIYVPPGEDITEEGKVSIGDGNMFSTCESYTKILQAVLNEDPRILNKENWKLAMKDDLAERGMSIPFPEWAVSQLTSIPIFEYAKATDPSKGAGANLLSCRVARSKTITGRPEGSFAWAGASNIYYFVDQENGLGGIIGAQFLPFYDTEMVELRDAMESTIYKHLRPSSSTQVG